MKRWLITALLFATGCTTQTQIPIGEQPPQPINPTTEADATVDVPTVAQNDLPQVVSVGDGDTLRVKRGNEIITIRLGCIDAPETAQIPWGQQAAFRLKQLRL